MKKSLAICAATAAMTLSLAGSAFALELKIGVSTAETDPRNIAAEQFAEEIAEKTGGEITAKVFPSGQLG